jgi:putative hydrolase of the HAD superfamily
LALKAVLFDLDDTLLWDDRSVNEAFEATCLAARNKYVHIDSAELEASVRKEAKALYEGYETFPFTKMIGINPFEAFWAHFSEGEHEMFRKLEQQSPAYRIEAWTRGLKGIGIEDAELGRQLAELFPVERRKRPLIYEETFRLLDGLKGRVKLLLLTNGAPDLQREKIAGVEQLESYFDHIVISGVFGEGKPSSTIFRHAMELLDIEASEGLMIGDKLTTDILGSNNVGMPNVWINRHNVTRTDEIIPAYEVADLNELIALLDQLLA